MRLRLQGSRVGLLGTAAPPYFTARMVRGLPDDGLRYETVHGELLVTRVPPWPHRRLAARLHAALRRYLAPAGAGVALAAPAGFAPGLDSLVQPDVFVMPLRDTGARPYPLVVAEVLAPSTERADRFTKRRLYQELGVGLYWLVDPIARAVEVWTPGALLPVIEYLRVTWHPPGAAVPFHLTLDDLFDA